MCSHAGKRASSPVFIQAEDVDDTGGKGNKNEMKDLEDRLVHSFTPGFPWGAFEAAAKQLKVNTCMIHHLLVPVALLYSSSVDIDVKAQSLQR